MLLRLIILSRSFLISSFMIWAKGIDCHQYSSHHFKTKGQLIRWRIYSFQGPISWWLQGWCLLRIMVSDRVCLMWRVIRFGVKSIRKIKSSNLKKLWKARKVCFRKSLNLKSQFNHLIRKDWAQLFSEKLKIKKFSTQSIYRAQAISSWAISIVLPASISKSMKEKN